MSYLLHKYDWLAKHIIIFSVIIDFATCMSLVFFNTKYIDFFLITAVFVTFIVILKAFLFWLFKVYYLMIFETDRDDAILYPGYDIPIIKTVNSLNNTIALLIIMSLITQLMLILVFVMGAG